MMAQIYYNFNNGEYQLLNEYGTDIVFDKPEADEEFFEFAKKAQGICSVNDGKEFLYMKHRDVVQAWLWLENLPGGKGYAYGVVLTLVIAPIPVPNEGDKKLVNT